MGLETEHLSGAKIQTSGRTSRLLEDLSGCKQNDPVPVQTGLQHPKLRYDTHGKANLLSVSQIECFLRLALVRLYVCAPRENSIETVPQTRVDGAMPLSSVHLYIDLKSIPLGRSEHPQ